MDWVIVAFISFGGINGLRRGFLAVLLGLAGYVLGVLVAARYTLPVLGYLDARFGLLAGLAPVLGRYLPLGRVTFPVDTDGLAVLREGLLQVGVPEPYGQVITDYTGRAVEAIGGPTGPGQVLLQGLAYLVAATAVFLTLFILTRYFLGILERLASGLLAVGFGESPLRLGGLLAGGLNNALILTLVLGVAAPVLTFPAFRPLAEAVERSILAPHLIRAFYALTIWLSGRVGTA